MPCSSSSFLFLMIQLKDYISTLSENIKISDPLEEGCKLDPIVSEGQELDLLKEDANVYKLIGPVLVKQDLAEANANVRKRIEYISAELVSRRDAFDHLICDGFLKGYVRWIFHGERCDGSLPQTPTNVEEREFEHDIHNILHDMMAERVMNNDERHAQSVDPSTKLGEHNHRLQGDKFYGLLKASEDERQPGWLTVKHAKLRDLFDMGDASSFEKDGEPEQLSLDDSVDTSISSWIRNDVGADGFDVTQDMENENVEEDPINEQNREAIF
ncbi:hypothetical protein V6N11_047884 [Hibiscus sabdariffa]|uniref:Uncharacterized protein n=1 Tax=Hibiscus sabdariffa TaxID=183260 RepID=A0ABR1ZMS3_9ROSI